LSVTALSPRASQTYDWSAFTHPDTIAHLPGVNREQLLKSLDQLATTVERNRV
jgi:hypothetical protein